MSLIYALSTVAAPSNYVKKVSCLPEQYYIKIYSDKMLQSIKWPFYKFLDVGPDFLDTSLAYGPVSIFIKCFEIIWKVFVQISV